MLRKQRASYEPVERAAQTGDRVTIDFAGQIDGADVPGRQGQGLQPVVLGEGRMLPEFESNARSA